MEVDSESENEDFLFGVESDLFEAPKEEILKSDEHRKRLERRECCFSLVEEAKRKAKGESSIYELMNGSILEWVDEKGNQQGQAWECSLRLCRAIEERGSQFEGKSVIELGCGLGIPGMVAALLGANTVLLSDLPGALGPALRVVDRNHLGSIVSAHPLLWGDLESAHNAMHYATQLEGSKPTITNCSRRRDSFDVILCSDLIYGDEEPSRKLVETITELSDVSTLILSLHERRMAGDGGSSFFGALEQSGFFSIDTIPFNATSSSASEVDSDAIENEFFCLTEIRRTK